MLWDKQYPSKWTNPTGTKKYMKLEYFIDVFEGKTLVITFKVRRAKSNKAIKDSNHETGYIYYTYTPYTTIFFCFTIILWGKRKANGKLVLIWPVHEDNKIILHRRERILSIKTRHDGFRWKSYQDSLGCINELIQFDLNL